MDPRSIIPNLSHEEELVVHCARTVLGPENRSRVTELLATNLDWQRIAEIAALHRLRPLLFKRLKAENQTSALPPEIWLDFQRHAAGIVARNLKLTNDLVKILKLFREAGFEVIPFKGPVLGLRSYGNLGLREFFDMDLLLRREYMARAGEILRAHGYKSPSDQDDEHIDKQLGCDFLSADGKIRLELHWSFIQKWLCFEVDLDAIWQRAEPFNLAGFSTHCVSREDLLIYLCAHGAKHHWERLFWIVDIAEIIRSEKNLRWPLLLERARMDGNGRILALGLYLAHTLLGAQLPPSVHAAIKRETSIPHLARQVGTWLFNEANRPAIGAWIETKFYWGAKERISDRARYGMHLLSLTFGPSKRDRAFVKLPPALSFLYPAVRPIRWLLQRSR